MSLWARNPAPGSAGVRHPTPAIAVEGLSKWYGSRPAVRDVSFEVADGSVTGFVGPNGSGKTTTLRILLGLSEPLAGSAFVAGRRYCDLAEPLRTVGAVLERDGSHPARTAADNLRVAAASGDIDPGRVEQVLDLVQLSDAAHVRTGAFSQGMRQRLALATALLGEPRVLLLDEPLNGVDPQGVRWFRTFVRDVNATGTTILISSHILSELNQIIDHVVVLSQGSVVLDARMNDLTTSERLVVRSPSTAVLADVLRANGGTVRANGGDQLTVLGLTLEQVGALVAAHGLAIYELRADAVGSLEELVLPFLGAEGVV